MTNTISLDEVMTVLSARIKEIGSHRVHYYPKMPIGICIASDGKFCVTHIGTDAFFSHDLQKCKTYILEQLNKSKEG